MNEAQGLAFLDALRVKQVRVKGNGWIEGSCPLAKWLHKHHIDSMPSFGLSIAPGERSYFLCFACRQGSVEELLAILEMYSQYSTNYDFALCHQILASEEYVVPLPEYGEFPKPEQVFTEWPQYWLESFIPAYWSADTMTYLETRKVGLDTVNQFQLRYDSKRHMVVAPYWDVFNRLAGARGRTLSEMSQHKHHDYSFQGINNARLVWYHETVLNLPGPVVVVEGQFDCWRTAQAYPKTIAALTAKPSLEKMKKLSDAGTVIQIPDRDAAGQQSVSVYAKYCQQLGLKHKVLHLDEGVKDPDDCHVDYLRERIVQLIAP